ncbi:MAG TPA: alkaline phosphatase family protein, partial [Beijerinckia sp.]|nr:alkaline phosphatase family protein [Beijerinckia sp.]
MKRQLRCKAALIAGSIAVSAGLTQGSIAAEAVAPSSSNLEKIDTIVVIYAENRSFDNLYGNFPGAEGLGEVTPEAALQLDRDGSPLPELPPIWKGLTAKVTEAQTAHLPNH